MKPVAKSIAFATFALTLACVAFLAHAAPPESFLVPAGPLPTEIKLRAAILKHLQAADRALDKRKPFKVLSGPTLASGNTFGGSLEQAWLMCVVVNAEKIAPGPQEIMGKSLYLRTSRTGEVQVVPTENWKDSSPQC